MTIFANDIKLMASDIMSDAPEGGGAVTGAVIVDGVSNNIFDDISTLDRVYGAVHLRKVFGAVRTLNTDKFYGSHMIITKLPGDQKLGMSLFDTDDWFDRREAAQTRIENYRAQGVIYNGFLWGTQYQGSRAIAIFQQERAPVPGIGDVLMLVDPFGFQYIRIQKLTDTVQTFTDSLGDYKRRILDIEISDVLKKDFNGVQVNRVDSLTPETKVFRTVIANAARYYSARPLVEAADATDLTVKVDSVFTQVVPSAQQEVAIIDASASDDTSPLVDAAAGVVNFTAGVPFHPGNALFLGRACLPGTLVITAPVGNVIDDGGVIKQGSDIIGDIDYAEGIVTFTTTESYYSSYNVTYRPAAAPLRTADTASLRVTAANRGFVWVFSINPPPKPKSFKASYRALSKWYDMTDNGKGGVIAQEPGIGTGSINYVSGSGSLTLGALPDVDTDILLSWSQNADLVNRSGVNPGSVKISYILAQAGFVPETLAIAWNDGAAKTATSDAAGVISGDATGSINLVTRELLFTPDSLPLGGTEFTITYSYGAAITKSISSFNTSGNNVTVTLGDTDIVPGSLRIHWDAPWTASALDTVPVGGGFVRQEDRDNGSGALVGGRSSTVNYAAGTVVFTPIIPVTYKKAEFIYGMGVPGDVGGMGASQGNSRNITGFIDASVDSTIPSAFTVTYRLVAAGSSANETITLTQLNVDLTPGFAESIVLESVLFTLGGRSYFDRSGQLFYNLAHDTGAATLGGTINYASGECAITAWASGQSPAVAVQAMATTQNFNPVDYVVFRVPVAPLKPGVMQVRATPASGGLISGNADNNGRIQTADMDGAVEYQSGVARVRFGQWVTAAGNESQPWYDPTQVFGGQIFKPNPVRAESILFNAVGYTYLPLSSDILGLDPVRLPPDGRVPIYAPGDVLVILHDQATTGTYTSAGTTDLGRTNLAKVTVRDAGGNQLDASLFSTNLQTGIVTWGNLSGVSQPLTITDRIEDMALCTDVQINGLLQLSQQLNHAYPSGQTLVANAVITKTIYARHSIPFDQRIWTNVWSDDLIGESTSAQYNVTQYPLVLENASCIQERWAIIFTNAGTVNVIGEHVGQVYTGVSILGDIAPINPNTFLPYFTIPAAGWGGGWSSGNVLRFNTFAANAPVWIVQSIAQGEETSTDYKTCFEFRGDIETV